jgi:hypothetical protein
VAELASSEHTDPQLADRRERCGGRSHPRC